MDGRAGAAGGTMAPRLLLALACLLVPGAVATGLAHGTVDARAARVLELQLEPGRARLSVSEPVSGKAARRARRSAGPPTSGALAPEQRQALAERLGRSAWAGVALSAEGSALRLDFDGAELEDDTVTVRLVAELPELGPEGLGVSLRDSAARGRASRLSVRTEVLRLDGPERAELGPREAWRARLFNREDPQPPRP